MRRAVRDVPKLPGMPSRRVLLILLLAGVGFTLVVALNRDKPDGPALATSCTTPAVAVKNVATSGGSDFRYAITGPDAGVYVVAVDAKSARVKGDGVNVTPTGAVAVAISKGLPKCRDAGTLPTLSDGRHEVQLFHDGLVVATTTLTSG